MLNPILSNDGCDAPMAISLPARWAVVVSFSAKKNQGTLDQQTAWRSLGGTEPSSVPNASVFARNSKVNSQPLRPWSARGSLPQSLRSGVLWNVRKLCRSVKELDGRTAQSRSRFSLHAVALSSLINSITFGWDRP